MTQPLDDEDPTPRSAPKKPGAAPAKPGSTSVKTSGKQPAPSPEPAGPAKVPWGHAGSVNMKGELTDRTGRPGVIRLIGAGVYYDSPPLDRNIWQRALEQHGRFEMVWTEADPAQVRPTSEMLADFRRQPALLDQIAESLLQITQQLHDHGWRLGLLHPGNILPVPGTGGRELVLPDLGFTWRGSFGKPPWKDNPGRPSWLDESSRNAVYWDEPPVFQQFTAENEYSDLAPVESDLHTLARIFAFYGLGRAERELPATSPSPAPVWDTLRDVLAGKVAMAEEFRARLEKTPLSQFFTVPQPDQPRKKGALAVLLLILGLLLLCGGLPALGVALWFLGGKPLAQTSFQGTPVGSRTGNSARSASSQRPQPSVPVHWRAKPLEAIPEQSELLALKKEYDAAKDPAARAGILKRMYQANLLADPKLRDREWHWMEYLRGQYVDEWIKRYHEIDLKVQKDITLRYEVAQELQKLNAELDGLRQVSLPVSDDLNERESQCLEISFLRANELGLPRFRD
ncbi:MAG TPA: hypothetical protein VGZ47_17395 [Gemmataceae bacterium]|jgi:hypothetical protein|nr:hypothetical protein [Gemmataceae bacterium]